MEDIIVRDIVEATNGILLCGDENTAITDLCIDSKEVREGDLFVPIIGERVDAHHFIEQALETGAATLTSEHDTASGEKPYIKVKDTVQALQDIGAYIRKRIQIPIIAVTGSVGKTTTRNMITTALRSEKRVFETQRNCNSQIGVPIMLSRISSTDEMAVLECGMSEVGQIDTLSKLVKPRHAVVSTIGVAHIEQLKTQENIRREKLSIINHMEEDGTLFLNGDDPMLAELRGSFACKTCYYGTQDWCDYRAEDIQYDKGRSYFLCVHGQEKVPVELSVLGRHNVLNCIAAIAVSHACGIPMERAGAEFAHFHGMRQNIIQLENRFTIIDDTYNASPDSMRASLDVLCHMETQGKRVAVLGDMFDLGENSQSYHYEIGEFLSKLPINELVAVGERAKWISQAVKESKAGISICEFSENEEAVMYLLATLMPGDIVLIKGSNGMHMNEIVRLLEA
ncbi:MAG: UDP-N-acetylmuramoyl-tripeptide--D-alanyl-D-alanine ligase [Bacteroides sp.]|nr:UDP-N-acetylmuramoyl-tripeptide--D-alanyl-D-alanine ligase [Bacteroides sp.]MCM1550199.1 UDP-N-acetylmuramoyl-tripeptide--D-alanyl-D-alanine ligase [Clostridium sp.]